LPVGLNVVFMLNILKVKSFDIDIVIKCLRVYDKLNIHNTFIVQYGWYVITNLTNIEL